MEFSKKRRGFLASVACQTALVAAASPAAGLLRFLFAPQQGQAAGRASVSGSSTSLAGGGGSNLDGPHRGGAPRCGSLAKTGQVASAAPPARSGFLFSATFNSASLPSLSMSGAAAGSGSAWMNRPALSALKNHYVKQGKIKKFHHFRLPAQNRTVYLYVFDSQESFREWRREVRRRRLFVREAAPPSLRCALRAGCLNGGALI